MVIHLAYFVLFMRPAGLEPAQVYTHCPLKTARLPFRHDRRTISSLSNVCWNFNLKGLIFRDIFHIIAIRVHLAHSRVAGDGTLCIRK